MTVGVSETGSGLAAGAHGVPVDGQRLAAALLSGFGLFVMILTFQPFAGVPDAIEPGGSTGNIVNQIGYVSLAIVYLAAMLKLCERGVLAQMATSSWIVVLMVAAFSAGRALEPDAALRALLLTGFAMVPVLGVLVLPRHERDFASAVANAALAEQQYCPRQHVESGQITGVTADGDESAAQAVADLVAGVAADQYRAFGHPTSAAAIG